MSLVLANWYINLQFPQRCIGKWLLSLCIYLQQCFSKWLLKLVVVTMPSIYGTDKPINYFNSRSLLWSDSDGFLCTNRWLEHMFYDYLPTKSSFGKRPGFTIYWWTSIGFTTYWKFHESVFDSLKVFPIFDPFTHVFANGWYQFLGKTTSYPQQCIGKRLLSICSLFTSMSSQLAVIGSNVLANGFYQFALYLFACLGRWYYQFAQYIGKTLPPNCSLFAFLLANRCDQLSVIRSNVPAKGSHNLQGTIDEESFPFAGQTGQFA